MYTPGVPPALCTSTCWTARHGLGTTAQAQHQVQRGLLLDIVVGQGAAVLQLLSGKDEALLVGGDACEAN